MGMAILGTAYTIATICDLKNKKIPNIFNLILLIIGIYFSFTLKNISIIKITGMLFLAFFTTYPLYYYNVLGAGDVKLFISSRLFLVHYSWLMLISFSLITAAIIFLVRLIVTKQLDFTTFHYYRFTPYMLLAYFILLLLY